MNRRLNMKMLNLWVTKAEEESLRETFKELNYLTAQNLTDILIEAHERGDFLNED